MTKKQIRIEITTQVKKAIDDFKKLEAQKKKNQKEASELNNIFKTIGGTLAVAFSGQQLASFATQAVQTNARIKTMERSFHSLGKSIGTNDGSLDKLRGALNGTMTDTELMAQANNAMLLGIVENDDEMAELFDNAQRLAQALGRDARYGVESLTTGIGRQSRLMLDNLGIIVKSEDAYKAYAKEIGVNTSQLTENQRKQAFIQATFESVRAKVAELGPEVLDLNQLFDANAVASENLEKEIGEKLEPMFRALLTSAIATKDSIADFVKELSEEQVEKIKEFGTLMITTAGILAGFRLATLASKNAVVLLGMSFSALKKVTGVLLLASAVEVTRNNIDKIRRKYTEFLLFIEENRALLSLIFPFIREPGSFDQDQQARIDELKNRIKEITEDIKSVGGEGEDIDLGILNEFRNLFIENGDVIVSVAGAVKDEIEKTADASSEITTTTTETKDLTEEIGKLQAKTSAELGKSLRSGKDIKDNLIKIVANFVLQIAKLKIINRLEKKITDEKKKQVALSAVGGFFGLPFATGGSFVSGLPMGNNRGYAGGLVTNRRTILPTNPPAIVGDNASGQELVEITPLPNPNKNSRQITININAPVVDEFVVDSIIPAIRRAEKLGL